VPTGSQLCETILANGIALEHACEMSCACTTCHVVIKEGFNSLTESDDDEDDLLDMAWGLTPQSRLSCQVKVADKDLVVELPKYTINHARENH
jgi:ferredoxin, 2Fe-2S